jgi:Mg2+-importing ATPase
VVIFMICTAKTRSGVARAGGLVTSAFLVVAAGIALSYSPAAGWLGFTAAPLAYLLFVAGATATYLFVVEIAKRLVFSRALA